MIRLRKADVTDTPEVLLDKARLGVAAQAQVNLLPPEVRLRRTLVKVKVRLGLALIAVVLAVTGGYVYSALQQQQATSDLEQKENEFTQLQMKQKKYADVPKIKSQIVDAQNALTYGTTTEVLWKQYLEAVRAVSPEGWTVETFTTQMPTPMGAPPAAVDPLITPGVGTIAFTGRAAKIPNVSDWLDALDSIPGFSGATFSSTTVTDDGGAAYYKTDTTVQVDQSVFAHRFAQQGDKG
jgi:Tfp pilus assembly protein PilN